MSTPLGIDLGTTRTSVAIVPPNQPEKGWYGAVQVLSLPDGPMTPSAVLFELDTEVVGGPAKNMGHRAADCAQVFKRQMPDGDWRFRPASRPESAYSAQELSARLLEHVAWHARRVSGLHDSSESVITVPAYFGEPERRRTRAAAESAHLSVLDIINEPTAAIIAYLFQPGVAALEESVLVFDLGGGTFDTVVVDIKSNSLRVTAIDGDALLGGRDFDNTIAYHLAERFEEAHPHLELPTADPDRRARMMLDIEQARESLSSVGTANVPVWGGSGAASASLNVELTRDEVDRIVEPLVDRCLDIAHTAVAESKGQGVVPTHVLFVGGMTKTPRIRERVMAELQLEELTIGSDPDLLVAKGAAIWAQKVLLERQLEAKLGRESIVGIDWLEPGFRRSLREVSASTEYRVEVLERLVRLQLRSITSQGYALRVFKDTSSDEEVLDYLLPAGTELPFEMTLKSYTWRNEVATWSLAVYEDAEAHRGTTNPDEARLVEVARGPMSRTWPAGTSLQVGFAMDLDQILVVKGWQFENGRQVDELHVTLYPGIGGSQAR